MIEILAMVGWVLAGVFAYAAWMMRQRWYHYERKLKIIYKTWPHTATLKTRDE